MGDPTRLEAEVADRDGPGRGIERLDVERLCREPGPRVKRIDPFGEAGRSEGTEMATGPELVRQVVPQRHEIDEVVGVEVAHDDRVEGARLDRRGQARKRALPEVQEDRRLPRTHE